MAPKKSPAAKQQTLAAAFSKGRSKREEQAKAAEGRWQVLVQEAHHSLLEDTFINTCVTDCEQYKKGCRLPSSAPGASEGRSTLTARRSLRGRKAARTTPSSTPTPSDDEDSDDDMFAVRSQRWELRGAAYLDALAVHLRPQVALQWKHQELLLFMTMAADCHTINPDLSTKALELLLLNARLHPVAQQDPELPHVLRTAHGMWRPHDRFLSEPRLYESTCTLEGNTCDKLHFLLSLLGGARRLTRQALGLPIRGLEAGQGVNPGAPGPVGLTLAFKYVATLLVQDYEARYKVFEEYGPHLTAPKQGMLGDPNAAKTLLLGSCLAQLLAGMHNMTTLGWAVLLKDVVHRLVGLVLDAAPAEWLGASAVASTPATAGKRRPPTAPPTASTAAAAAAAGPSAAAGAVTPGEVGWLAGQVLRCTYDLFLDMEEQRQMLPEDQKDTDCRMLADLLYRILTKKDGSPSLKSQIKEPEAKAVLLSVLSPRACLHLLSFSYARDASRRWAAAAGEAVIPTHLVWLQPLREYADGLTSVRLIHDEGPARADPVELLSDLAREDSFSQCRQCLLSHVGGEGFLTWLCTYTYAAAQAAQQGHAKADMAKLADAYNRVMARVQQEKGAGAAAGQLPEVLLHNRLLVMKVQRAMEAGGA